MKEMVFLSGKVLLWAITITSCIDHGWTFLAVAFGLFWIGSEIWIAGARIEEKIDGRR